MNRFEQELLKARKKQNLFFLGIAVAGMLGILLILAIMIVPRGVRILILEPEDGHSISIQSGAAFIVSSTLYSIFNEPVINVSAERYKSQSIKISSNDFGKVKEIKLEPLPPIIKLMTSFDDGQTEWNVNDTSIHTGDSLSAELEVGEHQVKISHPFFKETFIELTLGPAEIYEETIELIPVDGMLSIETLPDNAELYINDELSGSTPVEHTITGGEYMLEIKKDNFESITELVTITRDNPKLERNYKLEVKKGTVEISLQPEGGQLYLNNVKIPVTQHVKVNALTDNEIKYSKAGFYSQVVKVNLSAEETRQITMKLKQALGLVNIQSSPAAEVFVNNRSRGTTPLKLELSSVSQNISIRNDKYRSYETQIKPDPKREKVIDVRLLTEKQAALKEAKRTYKNSAGGEMRLFKPNETFTMGAARSERGQRANEFLRQVKLTRAFYAGVNEVTYGEYAKFDKNVSGKSANPVTSLSWLDAAKYCNWLSQREKLTPVYSINNNRLVGVNNNANGYRLLTEAEWEWLARKSNRKGQTMFVWGNDSVIPKGMVNVADESARGNVKMFVPRYNDGYASVAPVRTFAVETSGLFDQGGNVTEWTHDIYTLEPPTSGKIYVNPFTIGTSNNRVIKGANWRSGSITELRPSYREGITSQRDDLGFRLARYVYEE